MGALEVVPRIEGGAELREMIRGALGCRQRTMAMVQETIQRIVQVGRRLVQAKEGPEIDHGMFLAWLSAEEIVGEGEDQIRYRTAVKWMTLARFDAKHAGELDKAGSVNAAYRLAGLLPDPEAAKRSKGGGGGKRAVDLMAKIEEDLTEQFAELDSWLRPELEALEQTLSKLQDLHRRVQEKLGGGPPQEGISSPGRISGV